MNNRVSNPEYNHLSDEEVLVLSLTQPEVFGELIARYEKQFLGKARHVLGLEAQIEDVVQDTFVKIYLSAAKFKTQEWATLKSWMYKILINTCYTYYKKVKRDRSAVLVLDNETLALVDPGDRQSIDRALDLDFISSLVARLPGVLRQVSELHFLKGLSYEQVAEAEGVEVGTVRTRVHRAKKELKRLSSVMAY